MNNVNPNKYINSVEYNINDEGGLSIISSSKWADSGQKQQKEYRSIQYIESESRSGFLKKILYKIKNTFNPIVKNNNKFLLSLYHEINKEKYTPEIDNPNPNPYYTISREKGHIILGTQIGDWDHAPWNYAPVDTSIESTPRCIKKFVSLKEKEKLEILSLLYPHIVNRLNESTVFGCSDRIPLTLNEFSERQSSSAWEELMTQLIDTISDQSEKPALEFNVDYQEQLSKHIRGIPEEERENVFKQALSLIELRNNILITPKDTWRLIKIIPFVGSTSDERAERIALAKTVITDTMSVEERLELTLKVSNLPSDERAEIIALAKTVIKKSMNASERSALITTVETLPSDERAEIIHLAKTVLTESMDAFDRSKLITTVKNLPSSKRAEIIALAEKVITESMDASDRSKLITTVKNLPSSQRTKIIEQATKRITGAMPVKERLELIKKVQDEIDWTETLEQAKKVITANMSLEDKELLQNTVKNLPSDERENIINHTTQLMTGTMLPLQVPILVSELLELIDIVQKLPPSERAEIIYLAKTVIPGYMTPSGLRQLIQTVKELPPKERENIINQTTRVISPSMDLSANDLSGLITTVKELPPSEREEIIDQATRVIKQTQPMMASNRQQLIRKVRMIPADMRETIIDQTQERITEATEPQLVLDLIDDVCMANDINLASFTKLNPFFVNAKEVQTSPTKILVQYARQIAHWNKMPQIKYVGEPGNDAGGLTRDFIAKLLKALFESSEQNKLIDKEHRLQADTLEACQVMRALGVIFGAALHFQSFTTGQHFGSALFDIIKQIPTDIVKKLPKKLNSIDDLTKMEVYKDFRAFYLTTKHQDTIDCYKQSEKHLTDEQIYDKLLEDYLNWNQHMLAIANIAQSMNTFLTDQNKNWETVVKDKDLSPIIEGKLTKERLKQAIQGMNSENATANAVDATKDWIDAQKEGEEGTAKLVQFCEAVTGSPTLLPNQKIFVNGTNAGNDGTPFRFSTCARQLTVNWDAMPKNPEPDFTFNKLLTAIISGPQQFNQA